MAGAAPAAGGLPTGLSLLPAKMCWREGDLRIRFLVRAAKMNIPAKALSVERSWAN